MFLSPGSRGARHRGVYIANGSGPPPFPGAFQPGGRLTPATGTPVVDSGQLAQTKLYYTPHRSNLVPLWNGQGWQMYPFNETVINFDTTNFIGSSVYDVYVALIGGTPIVGYGPAIGFPSRSAAPLTRLYPGGLVVNNLPLTMRISSTQTFLIPVPYALYVGTVGAINNGQYQVQFNASGAGGAAAINTLYNAYNRVPVGLTSWDTNANTAPWTYATNTWRGADNTTNTRCTWLDGLGESGVTATYFCTTSCTAGGSGAIGIGFNWSSGTPTVPFSVFASPGAASIVTNPSVTASFPPTLGLNSITALEITGSGTTTFGSNGSQCQGLSIYLDQ